MSDTAVDFMGKLCGTAFDAFDLSRFVVSDGGFFDTRDELMERLEPKPSFLGVLVFNVLYGGRDIRRRPE